MESQRRSSPRAALAVTAVLFAIAWIENTVAPWAPFYVLYVALTVYLPLRWKTGRFGRLRDVRRRDWLLALGCGIGAQVALAALALGLVPRILTALGVSPEALAGPMWNPAAAQAALFERLALRWRIEPARMQFAYLAFLVVWAGFGEEVYFRGFLHAALRRWRTAAVVATASLLFGARHALQLTGVGGPFPWGAACLWSFYGTLFGLVLSWLYIRTGSLWPPIAAHYVFNVLPFALGAVSGS